MRKHLPAKRRALPLAIMLAGITVPALSQAQQDPEVEQIIVTGSYIRGTPQDAPSPVSIIDRDSIEAQGASVIWDVIRNLEVNSGSDTSVAGTNDAGQLIGTAQVNLRNLGGNSTLTLINGKRMVPAAVVTSSGQEFVDLNTIPLVMTDRIEVLTDGGSALYGSDAVAGVVNVIMRSDFEGLELYGDVQGIAEEGSANEGTLSAIWGWASDDGDTHLVLSGEYFDRDPVGAEFSSFYNPALDVFNGGVGSLGSPLELGASINPAYINETLTAQKAAERTALRLGASRGETLVLQDPLCEQLSGPSGAFYVDNRYSGFGSPNGACQESTLDAAFIAVGATRTSLAGTFEHTFSENAQFYSFFQYSDQETERQADGRGFSRSIHMFLPPPGTATGPAAPIFSVLELGAFAEAVGNTKPTAADITNSPLTIANGGLGTAMFGGGVASGWPRQITPFITDNITSSVQAGLRGEFSALGDRRMNYDVSVSWSGSSVEQNYLMLQRDRTELALQGLGGPDCVPNGVSDFDFVRASGQALGPFSPWESLSKSFNNIAFPQYMLNLRETFSMALTSNNHGQGGCQFYNPFLTALTNPDLANTQALQDWMTQDLLRADKQNKLLVFDAVVSGELFELPGGTAQFAVGAQYRDRNAKSRAPVQNKPGLQAIIGYDVNGVPNDFTEITNNLECAACIFNFDHDRDVKATFLELSLPIIDNVETQVAVRWEDYGGNIGSELTPKIAMSWRPIDELLVRGSYSQSFRAPNIGVVFESFESFGTVIQDPIRNQDVRAGLLPPTNENALQNFSFTLGEPNPDLGSESADTYSMGFQWTPTGPLDGFRFGADFWRFEVTDRVLPLVPRAAINREVAAFEEAVKNPNNFIVNSSLLVDAAIPFEPCNPAALEAQFGRDSDQRRQCVVDPRTYEVKGVQRLVGNTDGALVTLVLPATNAGNITVQGVDLKAGYNWDTDYGGFRVSMDYTHVDEYLVNDVPGLELGLQETGVFDAAGVDGEQNIVRSVPDNKGNINLSWSNNGHRVTLINRHIGSFQILSHDNFLSNDQENDINRSLAKPKSESYDTWDVQYNYTHSWANSGLGTTVFTVGIIDALNADLPLTRRQSFDRSVFDGRGRRWYARALWQL